MFFPDFRFLLLFVFDLSRFERVLLFFARSLRVPFALPLFPYAVAVADFNFGRQFNRIHC